jgi:predicted nucleic acid-binding protein
MKRRFIDTWFWITLIVETEPFHKHASEFLLKSAYQGDEFYTSGSVIAETTSGFLHSTRFIKVKEKKLLPEYAFKFFEKFKDAVASGQLKVLTANQGQIVTALDVLKDNFRKISGLSYFDCETVVLCRDEKIKGVLSADKDFEYLGLPIDEEWAKILNN